jgi:hypothetical protein
MIVRCPSCSSRRDIPSFEPASGGTLVDCQDCGHDWIEGMALPAALGQRAGQFASAGSDLGWPTAHQIVRSAREAHSSFQVYRRARRGRMAAWASLAALALAPLAGAALFPEEVVATLPASIRVYDMMGHDVNIYGLEIRQVDIQKLIIDGRKVIAVKGELANVSTQTRKIPWLRFGLRSDDNAEVFHWTLDTEVRPLKPGESTSFVTRLASPPEAAENMEIRFARTDEIGSNKSP